MVAKRKQSNRQQQYNQSRRKPPEMKSRTYPLRLNPEIELENAIILGIESAGNARLYVTELFRRAEGKPMVEPSLSVSASDIHYIEDGLEQIFARLNEVAFNGIQAKQPRRKKTKEIQLPDSVRDTVEHFAGEGFVLEDEE